MAIKCIFATEEEIFEDVYCIIEGIHTESIPIASEDVEEINLFINLGIYENIEERKTRANPIEFVSFTYILPKYENFGNFWEYSYNKIKTPLKEKIETNLIEKGNNTEVILEDV
jgi:hypothetical protein